MVTRVELVQISFYTTLVAVADNVKVAFANWSVEQYKPASSTFPLVPFESQLSVSDISLLSL